MKKVLEFSLRDWKQGQNTLIRMGFMDDEIMSNQVELTLDEWEVEDIEDELNGLDVEFEWI
tara:strand:- start:359 stop:541 length:183 start_codon:yes stop_codon:yes gene_type:complete